MLVIRRVSHAKTYRRRRLGFVKRAFIFIIVHLDNKLDLIAKKFCSPTVSFF
jgi:hypothetical protein